MPSCPRHHSARPRIAFIVAGQARSFLDDRNWLTYFQRVLKSFYAHGESRVFLHLKLGRGPSLDRRWHELSRVVDGLRPAVVRTTLERDVDLRASVMAHAHDGGKGQPRFQHPECFWRDEAPHFVLSRARIWWLTMAQAWESVELYEKDHAMAFEAVVFSRPDIAFERDMGPWCAYDLKRSWYAPWGEMVPDMFWIFPRAIAAKVLTTWTRVVLPCGPGQPCCNLTTRPGERILGRSPNIPQPAVGDPVTLSNWMSTYWTRHLRSLDGADSWDATRRTGAGADGGTSTLHAVSPPGGAVELSDAFAGLNYSLRGNGRVAANPNRVIFGKPRRNVRARSLELVCTSRLGPSLCAAWLIVSCHLAAYSLGSAVHHASWLRAAERVAARHARQGILESVTRHIDSRSDETRHESRETEGIEQCAPASHGCYCRSHINYVIITHILHS